MKKLNFPNIEKEVQPAAVVPKVSGSIQKRVMKLEEHEAKLESVREPNETQKKLLDCNRSTVLVCRIFFG